jgi:hypothetical protein
MSGKSYVAKEVAATGSLNAYDTTYQVLKDGAQVSQGAGSTVTISNFPTPDGANGPNYVVTFTNTPKPGGVEWAKADSSTAALLAGSEWKITGPSPSTQSLAVTDCTAQGQCDGTNDVNFVAGEFEVQGLAPGNYTLTETKAPDGYALLDPATLPSFLVPAGGVKDLGVLLNTKLPPTTGALAITKKFDSSVPTGSGTSTTFSGNYTCTPPAGSSLTAASGTWTVVGPNAATLTANAGSAAPTALPAGLSCAVTETSPASGSSTGLPNSYVWGTPTIDAAVTIAASTTKTVSVMNKAIHQTGSVAWNKTDQSGHALAGSEWTITPTNPSGTPITVVDNGKNDVDSVVGAIKVSNLDTGQYELQESKAPAGYVLSSTKYPFTITNGTVAQVNNGHAIENVQATPPVLPFTGGMSTDEFLLGGTAMIVLSLGLAFVWRRKRASSM